VKSIIADEQYSTIYKDTRQLAEVTIAMAQSMLDGQTPETNNTSPPGFSRLIHLP